MERVTQYEKGWELLQLLASKLFQSHFSSSLLNFTSMNVLRSRKLAGLPPSSSPSRKRFLPLLRLLSSFTQYKKYERLWPIAHFQPSFMQWFSTSFLLYRGSQTSGLHLARQRCMCGPRTKDKTWSNMAKFCTEYCTFFTFWPAEPLLFKTASKCGPSMNLSLKSLLYTVVITCFSQGSSNIL